MFGRTSWIIAAIVGAIALGWSLAPSAPPPSNAPDPWQPVATFSILGYDPETGQVGGAVQSRVFSVGNGVLWAEAGVGAIATQAVVDVGYGPRGLALLREGLAPEAVVRRLWDEDPDPQPERKTPSSRVGVNQRGERSDSARRNVATGRTGAGTTGEFLTCPRCGHLNHSNRRECERCQTLLQPDRVEQSSPAEQLAEADRLFRKNNFRESLRLYAQLAERETDRRQRSVLRAKEREARTRLEEEQAGEAEQRSQRLIAQGDVDGALKVLDRALADSSSAIVSQRLQDHIATLQKQAVGRRRRRRLLVSVVVAMLALAGAGYAFRVQVMAFVQTLQNQGKAP